MEIRDLYNEAESLIPTEPRLKVVEIAQDAFSLGVFSGKLHIKIEGYTHQVTLTLPPAISAEYVRVRDMLATEFDLYLSWQRSVELAAAYTCHYQIEAAILDIHSLEGMPYGKY